MLVYQRVTCLWVGWVAHIGDETRKKGDPKFLALSLILITMIPSSSQHSSMILHSPTHRIHGADIYGNMDPINILPMLAYIPAPRILWATDLSWFKSICECCVLVKHLRWCNHVGPFLRAVGFVVWTSRVTICSRIDHWWSWPPVRAACGRYKPLSWQWTTFLCRIDAHIKMSWTGNTCKHKCSLGLSIILIGMI